MFHRAGYLKQFWHTTIERILVTLRKHVTKYENMRKLIIIIIIIKRDWQCKAGRGRLTPYQSEDPSPTLPTYRGKLEKAKIAEDKKGQSN